MKSAIAPKMWIFRNSYPMKSHSSISNYFPLNGKREAIYELWINAPAFLSSVLFFKTNHHNANSAAAGNQITTMPGTRQCFLHMQIHIMKYGIVTNNIVP